MDLETEEILIKYRDILLEYLFNKNEELIEKWNNDKKISLKKEILEKFEPLLYGDWNRNYYNNKLNLNNLKNTKIKPSEIFKMLINEITIKSKPYNYNFNPNWFFLFFDKFYHYNLGNNLYLDFEYDDDIKLLKFNNYDKLCKIIRDETLIIIIFHSRFVLNGKITDYLHNMLGIENTSSLFEEIFIKNCLIQKPININESSKRFVDLAYQINKKENLIIEINEYHHDPYLDKVRKKEIIFNSEIKNTFINYDVIKYSIETLKDTGDLLVKSLCKILYNDKDNINKSLQIYLTDIENLESQFVDLYVDVNLEEKNFNLENLFKTFFDGNIDLNKIIKQHVKYGNINKKDFKNFNLDTEEEKEIINYLIENKDKLVITYYGIKNIIMTMKNKDVKNRNNLLKYLDDVENNYYKMINDIIKNDDLEYFYEEINHYKNLTDIQNAIILNKINIDKYFKIINNNKKYNQYIPFLIYKENNIIKKKDIICLVKKDIDTRDDYIRDYRLLSLDEINKILE